MSGTLNPAEQLCQSIQASVGFYVNDLKALKEGAYATPFTENVRSVQQVTAEVINFNTMTVETLNGRDANWEALDQEAVEASIDTIEKAIVELNSSVAKVCAAIQQNSDSLGEVVNAAWGSPASKFIQANVVASHLWYHDGQICFIQQLQGDKEFHWFDGQG